ncbi:MAG: hypothetical protein NXY57DRAFT_895143 [Lentinula lateritia]|nr:MAG: hypothetical protein NXY57DRAFT_895143 [Lentinula lateritia]
MSPETFSSGPNSDSSSTYAPSTSDRGSVSVREERSSIQKDRGYFVPSDAKHTFPSTSSSTLRHLRTDLIKVLGPDLATPTTEISTIPCAGVRIASGRLIGLMGWRLVIELVNDDDDEDHQNEKNRRRRTWGQKQKGKGKFKVQYKTPAIVGNFILDTGSAKSVVSQDALRALKYHGNFNPGAEVTLRIQGVRTECLVARLGEASTLGGQFMTSGNLTFYFDNKMNAPVLYGEYRTVNL